MIELKHLSKIYDPGTPHAVTALEDISLDIHDGEIFGIIGLSGAGKSTLVRCINLLEKPTSGQVLLDGRDLTALPQKELLKARRSVGMIFQDFNLLEQRTVLRNVLFPLELAGTPARRPKSVRWSFCSSSDFPSAPARIPRSSRAARSSASPSLERWPPARAICCATRRPPRLTPRRPARSSSCWQRSTGSLA